MTHPTYLVYGNIIIIIIIIITIIIIIIIKLCSQYLVNEMKLNCNVEAKLYSPMKFNWM